MKQGKRVFDIIPYSFLHKLLQNYANTKEAKIMINRIKHAGLCAAGSQETAVMQSVGNVKLLNMIN